MTTERNARRWIALAAVMLAVAGGLVFLKDRGAGPIAQPSPSAAELSDVPQAEPPFRADRPAPPAQASDPTPDVGVTIDSVEVDKQAVCRGEEAIVTIHARATDGRDEHLNYGVMGQPGLVGPRFPLHLAESLGYGWMRVYARGKSGAATVASVPPVVVKDCDQPVAVTIEQHREARTMDRVSLTARIAVGANSAQTFVPVEYVWDFADGHTATTRAPEVEHSYESRPQNTAYSYYLVKVTVRDADGREARGSRSLRFVNLGFGPSARDRQVSMFAGVGLDAAGGEKIWLYHGHSQPVSLGPVTVKDVVTGPSGKEDVVVSRQYDALSLLGFSAVPAGQSPVIRDLSRLRPSEPELTRVVELSGFTPDGKSARGAFNLVAPQSAVAMSPQETQTEPKEERP